MATLVVSVSEVILDIFVMVSKMETKNDYTRSDTHDFESVITHFDAVFYFMQDVDNKVLHRVTVSMVRASISVNCRYYYD